MLKKIILFLTLFLTSNAVVVSTVLVENNKPLIYLDPGHGGYDGGCVSYNKDIIEKNVTLNIALAVKRKLNTLGYNVLLTRNTDTALGNTKKKDIYKRVDLINNSEAVMYLSIHANSFTSSDIKGAQTFYNPSNEINKDLAVTLLNNVRTLDETNERVAKSMTGKYLLDHVTIPGCLIEVGFITNMEDLNKLTNETYINDLAMLISISINEVYSR